MKISRVPSQFAPGRYNDEFVYREVIMKHGVT